MIFSLEYSVLQLRQQKPLVLCLTNFVTMDIVANSLLALGAAPLMSNSAEELEDLIKLSSSLYINIGTLDAEFITRCRKAIALAKHYKKPIILDPVGAGASTLRTQISREFVTSAHIIRGNASEIMALLDDTIKTHGVETLNPTPAAKEKAILLAQKSNSIVVISGAEDFITDGQQQESLSFGSPIMPFITGMGCSLTAILSAFSATTSHYFLAAKNATCYFSLCGNLAQTKALSPGSFRVAFLDALYEANFSEMRKFL